MRILISAYACEPGKGSEPEVGLQIVLAAASQHDVWVITRENNLPSLRDHLKDHALRERIHLVGLEVEGLAKRLKKRGGLIPLHWYYDKWQRRLAEVAIRLDEEFDFDVVHHATFASYWTRAGVASVDKPLVWGPVGGGVKPPFRLLPVMGLKGAIGDLARLSVRPMFALITGSMQTASRAAVVLTQNPETARVLRKAANATVLPNALLATPSVEQSSAVSRGEVSDSSTRLIVAGRLIGWKAQVLALQAMTHLPDPLAELSIFGDGPERPRLEILSQQLGLQRRVHFRGTVPRGELLSAIGRASVLIHSALHEEGGFVVAEALSLGTPVICLDRGGPPVVCSYWPGVPGRLISPSTPTQTAQLIAQAVVDLRGKSTERDLSPSKAFDVALTTTYVEATSRRDGQV